MKLDLEVTAAVWRESDVELLARIRKRDVNGDKVPAVAADIASIAWVNYNAATGAVLASGTFTVADVMLAALCTGTIWDKDMIGFNFDALLAAANLTAGVTNKVLVTFTSSGTPARTSTVGFRMPVQ
jgi:hypothetical protein